MLNFHTNNYKQATHGELLYLIKKEFESYLEPLSLHSAEYNNFVFVREKGYLNPSTYVLSKVNGVLELALFNFQKNVTFIEFLLPQLKSV